MFCWCFLYYGAHRERHVLTHSFPTRRSSDLLWEINEAFAVVAEKFIRDLDLDRDRVNVNGGAIALGHPIGATGAMLVGTVLDELERTGGRYGPAPMCAGGGMAPAVFIDRLYRLAAGAAVAQIGRTPLRERGVPDV